MYRSHGAGSEVLNSKNRSTVLRMPDHAAALRDQVAARVPVDDRERRSIREFLDAFDRLTDPFSESADATHVTASAVVVGSRGVVLHRHKRLGLWLQPGGHIDPGEAPWNAAAREAAEETGLPVSLAEPVELLHVDVHPGPRGHTHLDVRYLLHAPDMAPAPPEGESPQVEWFPWHRAVAIAEPGLEGVLRALQPGEPKIRSVRGSDAADCADVYVRARAWALADLAGWHGDDLGDVRRWIADDVISHHQMWVAEVDGTVVGFAAASGRWLDQCWVDPAWRARSVGDELLNAAVASGARCVWALTDNAELRTMVERHGFAPVEFADGTGNADRLPDVRYILTELHGDE
jgi:8-oxo-dGTP pyrophosphatase MutT (NUDIX family)